VKVPQSMPFPQRISDSFASTLRCYLMRLNIPRVAEVSDHGFNSKVRGKINDARGWVEHLSGF